MYLQCKTDILPEAQQALWPQLKEVPGEYVLYGGTAIALRYGHRASVDFDFFSTSQKDIHQMASSLSFIKNNYPSEEYLKSPFRTAMHVYNANHLDFFLETVRGTKAFDEEKAIVKVTFANNKGLIAGAVNGPDTAIGNGIKIASPLDLLAAKLLALSNRSQSRDFVDLAELIRQGLSLQKGFEAAFAISRLSPQGSHRINYQYLKEDLKSKTIKNFLPERPKCVEIIRESASQVDVEKVMKTRLKANPQNYMALCRGR